MRLTEASFYKDWHPKNSFNPEELTTGSGRKVWWKCSEGHEWEAVICSRKNGRGCPVCAGKVTVQGFNDLSTLKPELANQWHPTKNNNLQPREITTGSGKKVWWKCSEDHEWEAVVKNRVAGRGCPVCAGKTVIKNINDLSSTHPELISQWDRKNTLQPTQVTAGSNRKVWWGCSEGHEWEAVICSRATGGTGCPYCAQNKIDSSNNFLAHAPQLKKYLKPDQFGTVDLSTVSLNSTVELAWVCEHNHEWKMPPFKMVKTFSCPICKGRVLSTGINDLQTKYPELAEQWQQELNQPITPAQVPYSSRESFWWKNKECKHMFKASIARMVKRQNRCLVCVYLYAKTGVTDLKTLEPELANQWHPTKNFPAVPEKTKIQSGLKIWWVCEKNHEWQARVADRSDPSKRTGCPYCSNRKVIFGFNDLATLYPKLATQISKKNTPYLDATKTFAGSNIKIIWECDKNHTWSTSIRKRTLSQTNCPFCSKAVSKAETEIFEYFAPFFPSTVIQNDRKILGGKELDLYFPTKKIAIEYNGLYWHTERPNKPETYHYDKWLACKEKGIQLIQVWEDDWNKNPELIKRMLAAKLGVSQEPKVYARNTQVKQLTVEEATIFLDENHLQGSVNGGIRLGLTQTIGDIEKLVAVMVLKKEPGVNNRSLNLVRYATSTRVPGGFTKLLKYVERTYTPNEIVTFSDNCVSDGGLYRSNGFTKVKDLTVDYMYVVKGKRTHKFGYRSKRVREDPELEYEEGLTEKQLAELNNLLRVWDAGKVKWVFTCN